jgi:hypothetical protein
MAPTAQAPKTATRKINPAPLAMLKDFELTGGQLSMPMDKLIAHIDKLMAAPKAKRAEYFDDVVVLAGRLVRTRAKNCGQAVAQLLVVATLISEDKKKAEKAFAASGVDVATAKKFMGEKAIKEVQARVDAEVRTSGLFGLMKSNRDSATRVKSRR